MVCYQVLVQYAFIQHKAVLVSTYIKKQNTRAFLVQSGLPFGSGLKYHRFFKTKKEATRYVSYLHTVYKCRIMQPNISSPPLPGGQQYLFQEVSE
jgi:dihydroorotate dehydrogenase